MLVLVLIVQVATLDEAINGAGVVEDAGVGEEAVHHGVQHVGGEQAVGAGVVARPAARCTPSAAATCSRPPRMPPPPPQNLARCFTSSTAGPNILLTFAMNPSRVLGSGRPPVSTLTR